jgi:hypothetical protein
VFRNTLINIAISKYGQILRINKDGNNSKPETKRKISKTKVEKIGTTG